VRTVCGLHTESGDADRTTRTGTVCRMVNMNWPIKAQGEDSVCKSKTTRTPYTAGFCLNFSQLQAIITYVMNIMYVMYGIEVRTCQTYP
jgi:hypothetical protein